MILPVKTGTGGHNIYLERGALKKAGEYLNLSRRALIVTDSGVPKKYAETVAAQCREPYIVTLPEGEKTDSLGLVMSGSVLIVQDDFWGNRNIMARITQGGIFAESFACTGEKLTVGAEAESECEIMRLKVGHVLGSCPKSCAGHAKLVGNLISELARKNLNFNSKLGHMGKRTTREKLMSYLSAQAMKSGKNEFDIPFDRQQLADYLCVDRSAMSAQLCALRDEGILKFRKNHFVLNRI